MTAGNEKALGLITLKVSENLYKKIGDSAYDTWELFKSEFGVTGAATRYLDWIKLKEFAMVPGHPPAEQINQLRYLINKLEPHFTLPESLQTLILLGSLPSDWRQNFQTLLMTLKPTELTLAHVIPRINEEYTRRVALREVRPPQAQYSSQQQQPVAAFQQNPSAGNWQGRGYSGGAQRSQGRGRGQQGQGRGRGRAGAPYQAPAPAPIPVTTPHHQPYMVAQPQQQQQQQQSGSYGFTKAGVPRRGPNTQTLPNGQKG